MVSLMQLGGQQDWLSWIIFFVFITILQLYAQKFQIWKWMNDISNALSRLKSYVNDASNMFIEEASKLGVSREEADKGLSKLRSFFVIEPVSLDPTGLIKRLEHIIDGYQDFLQREVSRMAPKADENKKANLRDQVEGIIVLDQIYRVVRHYLILGKRTQNWIYIAQIQMMLPEILRIAKAYWRAGEAFRRGLPIGDSIGPLVALNLIGNAEVKEIAPDVVGAEIDIEGRRVLVVKAKGPGGNVGKPGEAIERVIESRNGNIARIIMIDAAAKLEGEPTGEIAEGVGAAIGDPGPEKWKIEQVATKYGIPIDSIVIKMDQLEAITVMRPEIAKTTEEVVKRVKEAVVTRTRPGDYVIVAGIGNSIGIANREEEMRISPSEVGQEGGVAA